MKLKKNRISTIICLLITCFLIACGGKASSATEDPRPTADQSESFSAIDESISDSQTVNEETEAKDESSDEETRDESLLDEGEEKAIDGEIPEGYPVIGGTWKVGGIYSKGHLIDINDVDAIKSMYDTTMITFNEDGTFVYLDTYINRGVWSEKKQDPEGRFILKTESISMYDLQDGSLIEKETETSNKKQYIVALLDENTFILNEYDSITGKAKANDNPYFFVKQGGNSKYISDNKTPINNSGSSQSSTDKKPSKLNNTDNTNATSGAKNALAKALQYLDYSAFSYSGLVEQLEYEGYSHSESTYAADHCGANWKDQAVNKALSYLDVSAFSYSGLVEQLEYEGFTSFEAQYGADNCGADWKAQAIKKAKQYLEYSTFSRSELIDQLVFEGFTQEQAEYGVSQAY